MDVNGLVLCKERKRPEKQFSGAFCHYSVLEMAASSEQDVKLFINVSLP